MTQYAKETWSYYPPKKHDPTGLNFEICIHHGSVEIESRVVPSPCGGMAFQGRSIHRNKFGQVTNKTEWSTTGVLK